VTLRFHEIAESGHRILNPLSEAKLLLLGDVCAPAPGARHLDLACGKGELLCLWARRYATRGVGVDVSEVFLAAARARAEELGVEVEFVHGNATTYRAEPAAYAVVSCLGATWIGGGLVGTLRLMAPALAPDGLLLVGEPYWIDPPPPEARRSGEFASLVGVLDGVESAGFELVEMVLSDQDDWDRYAASQWKAVSDHLRDHPDDELREWSAAWRRTYLAYERRYLGWGVFVLRRA